MHCMANTCKVAGCLVSKYSALSSQIQCIIIIVTWATHIEVAVWLNGNGIGHVNEVALCWARQAQLCLIRFTFTGMEDATSWGLYYA